MIEIVIKLKAVVISVALESIINAMKTLVYFMNPYYIYSKLILRQRQD